MLQYPGFVAGIKRCAQKSHVNFLFSMPRALFELRMIFIRKPGSTFRDHALDKRT
jgi:hypothetical protein